MATEPNKPGAASSPHSASPSQASRYSTGIDGDEVTSMDVAQRGSGTPGEARTNKDASASLQFDPRTGKLGAEEGGVDPEPAAKVDAAEGDPEAEGGDGEKKKPEPKDDDGKALPKWDPENEETRAAYDTRFFNADQKLNLAALTTEFWGNAKDGKAGSLGDDTYSYLEHTLGVTKEAAKSIEKGLVADRVAEDGKFWQRVGGKQRYADALQFGKDTYSPEAKERFNKAITGTDSGARDDAIDALMMRYMKANPQAAGLDGRGQAGRRVPPPRRGPSSPERSITTNAGAAGGGESVPYPTQAAYQEAFTKANAAVRKASPGDQRRSAEAELAKVHADGRKSNRSWK